MLTQEQMDLLTEWEALRRALDSVKALIEKEREVRQKVAAAFFPAPEEGTNTLQLAQGYKLKLVFKLDRKVDEAALPSITARLQEMQVNTDRLVEWKPSVKLPVYRELTAEQRAIFDEALIIKPSSPTLELTVPAAEA